VPCRTHLLLEHPHVYTLGRNANREHLLASAERLSSAPGSLRLTGVAILPIMVELVGYPILDPPSTAAIFRGTCARLKRSSQVAAAYDIQADAIQSCLGLGGEHKLVQASTSPAGSRRMGLRSISTLTWLFHGSCPGLRDKGVTSLGRLLGREIKMENVAQQVVRRSEGSSACRWHLG
jgi:lipoyl(octanoyl) transferase